MSVRLCFLVNIRNARGRITAGESWIDSVEGFNDSIVFWRRIEWIGVPKAGEEEGIGSILTGFGSCRNEVSVRFGLVRVGIFISKGKIRASKNGR